MNAFSTRREHREAIEAEGCPRGGRHISQRGEKILIDGISLAVKPEFLCHVGLKAATLFGGIGQFAKGIGEFDTTDIKLEALGKARIIGAGAGEGGFGDGIAIENRRTTHAQMRLDPLAQNSRKDVAPRIVLGDAQADALPLAGEPVAIVEARLKRDAGMALESFNQRETLRLGESIAGSSAKSEFLSPADFRRQPQHGGAIGHQGLIAFVGPVPFEHHEFRCMQARGFARPENGGKLEDVLLSRRDQLLHREFRRGVEITARVLARRIHPSRPERMQMRLVAGRDLHDARLNLEKVLPRKLGAQHLFQSGTHDKPRPPPRMALRVPERGTGRGQGRNPDFWKGLAFFEEAAMEPHLSKSNRASIQSGFSVVKVIASSIRKGNVIELDDKLYSVISAESFFPGKGTPTTQIDARRLSDGVKTTVRYRTTEQVEKAYVEEKDYTYLYPDENGFIFMDKENYEQVTVPADTIGDGVAYLQENMEAKLGLYNGIAVTVSLPQRVILEITETEPVTKGQTASSSYKPAILSNGVRTLIPPHVTAGTRVVINTEDGSYVERAKD